MKITENEKNLPICHECDVAVVGGGIAGIAAALAAARQGAKVVLVEKQCALGGLATSGLITIYLPLCDGEGHQVSFGIAEELFMLSVKYGAQRKYPKAWLEGGTLEERIAQRFEVQYNPVYFQLLAEELLTEAGVDIFYDTLVCDTLAEDDWLTGVIVENTDGRSVLKAKAFVDASGDARLFYMAGAATATYERQNILAAWYYSNEDGKLKLNKLGTIEESNCIVTDRQVDKPLSRRRFRGVEAAEVNEFLLMGHRQMLLDIRKKRNELDDFEAAFIPGMPQFRMTRRMVGNYELGGHQYGEKMQDSIGMVADWRRRGYIYEIPFGCLHSDKLKNVFAAGRNISVDDEMWDVSRVIPACAVTGEAVGIAAVMAGKEEVSVEKLQNILRKNGQKLHIEELDGVEN